MGLFDALKAGAALTPADLTSEDYYTVRDTAQNRRGLARVAKKRGLQLPDQPGAQYGHRVTVEFSPNVLRRKVKPLPLLVTVDKMPVDEYMGDRAAHFHRLIEREGGDFGTADGFLYRGASGDWRLRVMVSLPDE
jgi:hypothetical protein